jgi:hypothetical protein
VANVEGASGGKPATTVVDAAGLVPSLLVPVTEMVYEEPFVNPINVHVVPPTVEQVAFPGVAVAVYVTPATLPNHDTTAPEFVGKAVREVTCCGGMPDGTNNNRFAV